MFQFLRSFRLASPKTPARSGSRPRSLGQRNFRTRALSFHPQMEQLEVRRLMTASPNADLQLGDASAISSYAGVGFQENQVATLAASVNGEPDTTMSDFKAQINWGNGESTGDLVYMGINGGFADYLIKGSNTYTQANADQPITVTVTGPDGSSASAQTTYATVAPMPSGIPGTQPSPNAHSSAPENVDLQLGDSSSISSYSGVGFQENEVATLAASVNGKPDTQLSDFQAQINFGDDDTWNPGDLVFMGTNGGFADYLIKGSHTYDQTSSETPIVVFVNGPDGTSASVATTFASVSQMPSGIPGTQPSPATHSSAPADVLLQLGDAPSISATAGVGFQNQEVATLAASVNGQPDKTLADFSGQINWGDDASWNAAILVYEGTNGGFADYQISGSHTYQKTGSEIPIVVFVNGPDGTSTSNATTFAVVGPNTSGVILGNLSQDQWDDKQPGYNGTIPLSGGNGTYDNPQVTGLPPGLTATVNQDDVDITGTPTQSGTFNLQVGVSDSTGGTNSKTFSLQINAPVALGPLNPTQWKANQSGYDGTITVTGGTGTYSNLQVSGLPTGLSASLSGGTIDITGTPTQSGTFSLTASAQDSDGEQGNNTYTLTITAAAITLGPLSPTQWNVNQSSYNGSIAVAGGSGVYSGLAVTGLPTGLSASLSGHTISITGTPTQAGTFTLGVSLQDSNGTKASGNYSLTITAAAVTLGPLSPTQWNVNQSGYNGSIAVAGGSGVYSGLAVTGLPTGLSASLSGHTISISGTPTKAGTFTLGVSLQDSNGTKASGNYSLTITAAAITLGPLSPTQWSVNQSGYNGSIAVAGGSGVYSGLVVTGLPTGLSASLSGHTISITGTPTQAGTFTLGVSLQDSNGTKASGKYTLTINSPSASADLAASVNYNQVHPTSYAHLNLYFFYGNEQVTVPVAITNKGTTAVKGTANVSLYLSQTPNLSGKPVLLQTQSNVSVNLAGGAQQTVNFNVTIPATLTATGKYYLVANVSSSNIKDPNLANNTAATSKTYEFVGTPSSNPTVFTNGTFLKFVNDTLHGTSPIPASAHVNTSNGQSFTGYFEGDHQYAYLDSSNIPTIGVGINLTTVSGTLKHTLAQDVRSYYQSQYHQTLSTNDTTVINMLISQAPNKSHTTAISVASDQALFQQAYPVYQNIASSTLGSAWSTLNNQQQIAVVDLVYNMGSLTSFPSMTSALKRGDLLQAGFQLVDAVRTNQAPGLTTRTEAEFQNLFAGHVSLLGQLI